MKEADGLTNFENVAHLEEENPLAIINNFIAIKIGRP